MDIEKLKDQYRDKPTAPKLPPQAPDTADSQLIVKAQGIKDQLLDWAKAELEDGDDLEIKEVKDIASIVANIANTLKPQVEASSTQVNVLVQNFIDGQVDDC